MDKFSRQLVVASIAVFLVAVVQAVQKAFPPDSHLLGFALPNFEGCEVNSQDLFSIASVRAASGASTGASAGASEEFFPLVLSADTREPVNASGALKSLTGLSEPEAVQIDRTTSNRLSSLPFQVSSLPEEDVGETAHQPKPVVSAQPFTGVGNCEIDPVSEVILGDSEFRQLYGFARNLETVFIKDWLQCLHVEDQFHAQLELQDAISLRQPYRSEFRVGQADGTLRTYLAYGQVQQVWSEGTWKTHLLGTHVDISSLRSTGQEFQSIQVERQRIRQELHDGLGQQITGLSLLAKGLENSLRKSGMVEVSRAQELAERIPELAVEMKRIVLGAGPSEIETQGFLAAIRRLAAETEMHAGVRCVVDHPGALDVDDLNAAHQLYRIVQECISNALRHSEATEIRIEIRNDRDELVLKIADNGVGLSQGSALHRGLGMSSLNHRATRLGAILMMESEQGDGTTVCCHWPRRIT